MSLGRLKIAAALVITAPFIPMLFQGEEWGASSPFIYFTDHKDAELGRAVTEGRRREFAAFCAHVEDVPDPQAPDTFECSRLNWGERETNPHAEMLDWHHRLIGLRRKIPALSDGRLERVAVNFDEQAQWIVMTRGTAAVACNLAGRPQQVPLQLGAGEILLSSTSEVRLMDDRIELPPESVAVVDRPADAGHKIEG